MQDSDKSVGVGLSPVARSMRLPLTSVAAAMIAGFVLGRWLAFAEWFWLILAFAAFAVTVCTWRMKHLGLLSAAAALVCVVGLSACYLRTTFFSARADHIATFTPYDDMLATVRGTISTSPQIRAGRAPAGYNRPPRTMFILQADSIRTGGTWADASGLVRVTVRAAAHKLRPGQRVELVGALSRFRPPANPGQTDWRAFARRTGVHVRMSVPVDTGATILPGGAASFTSSALWHVKASSRQHLLACGDSQEGHLLNALILGERDPALRRMNETMARAGVAHLLSISGLHLGVFLGFVYMLCGLAGLSRRRAVVLVLVVLGAYVLLAEPRAPLLRSAIMAAVLCWAVIANRQYAAANALAAAAILLLIIDPLQILSPGFQLSFMIVGGLIVMYRPVRNLLFGRWLKVRGLMVFRQEQRFARFFRFTLASWLINIVSASVAAYVVSIPLVAYHFRLFTPYAPLFSIVMLPLVVAILIPGYVSMALAWPLPALAGSVRQIAISAADAMSWTMQWVDGLWSLGVSLRPVGVLWPILYYVTLLALLKAGTYRLGKVAAGVAIAATIALGIWTQRPAPAPDGCTLDMLAVGPGQCVVLRTPSGQTWLLDAGSQSGVDTWKETLEPFMLSKRLPSPAGAFISRAATDHFNVMERLLSERYLAEVYLNEYFGADPSAGAVANRMMDRFVSSHCSISRLKQGDSVQLDADTRVEVLWPPRRVTGGKPAIALKGGDTSLVMRITSGTQSVLVCGDIGEHVQKLLAARGESLRADVLILPRHGAWTPAMGEFVRAVDPRIVLASSSRDPAAPDIPAANPRQEARAQFYSSLLQERLYYCTRRNGWIRVSFGADKAPTAQVMR